MVKDKISKLLFASVLISGCAKGVTGGGESEESNEVALSLTKKDKGFSFSARPGSIVKIKDQAGVYVGTIDHELKHAFLYIVDGSVPTYPVNLFTTDYPHV